MIIFDLEWNRSYDKIPLEEILQIGAVRVERLGGPIVDTCSLFIHPRVHAKFNKTAKALPELQASLDSTLDFPAALSAFLGWCGEDRVFADWGGDDFEVLRQNCVFWKLTPPEPERLIDLQAAFSLRVETNQGVALSRAVEYCQIPTPFTFHNALNDALYSAMLTPWLDEKTMALLALPKEIRRLSQTPDFPPQPSRQIGPYPSVKSARNSRSVRRQSCPLCGEAVWVRRWYPAAPNRYFSDFRCKTHGSFLCQLSLSPLDSGQWQSSLSTPEITPAVLQDFQTAIRAGAISCKSSQRKSGNRRRSPRRGADRPRSKPREATHGH